MPVFSQEQHNETLCPAVSRIVISNNWSSWMLFVGQSCQVVIFPPYICTSWVTAVFVLFPLRNPFWLWSTYLISSRNFTISLYASLSRIFENDGRTARVWSVPFHNIFYYHSLKYDLICHVLLKLRYYFSNPSQQLSVGSLFTTLFLNKSIWWVVALCCLKRRTLHILHFNMKPKIEVIHC